MIPKPPRITDYDSTSYELMTLALEKAKTQRIIPDAVLRQSEWKRLLTDEMTGMVLELSTFVVTERLETKNVTKYAYFTEVRWASWWQHTKAVHFPTLSRWLRRLPRLEHIEHKVPVSFAAELKRLFPNADVYPLPPKVLRDGVLVVAAW